MALMTPPSPIKKKKPSLMIAIGIPKDPASVKGGPQDDSTSPQSPSASSSVAPSTHAAVQPPASSTPPTSDPTDPLAGGGPATGGQGQADSSRPIPPDAVGAHTADQICKTCEYMGPNAMCSWLQMAVGEGSPSNIVHCHLWEAKGNEPDKSDASGMNQSQPLGLAS
jgi:hypothetical protein